MIGRTIDHFQILEKLGEGGMGAVYKARDTKLNRTVAIKVLPPDKVSDPDRIARFVQEARAASALNSPNIITIHDISSYSDGEYIVMEFVEGRTLSEIIIGRELRLPEIMKIAVQVADALAAAHAAGIVHRDLKPNNIMVGRTGLVKVLDFGLAKLAAGAPKDSARTLSLPRSGPGLVLGTVGYMSPEQVRAETLDRRSDIFNFGLILHEMLSGARTFQGETSVEVMTSILREPAPELPETVPAALRQIVSVCLEKNPANRFESARDIGFALRALQAGSSTTGVLPKVEAGKKKLSRLIPAGAAVVFAAGAMVMTMLFLSRPQAIDLSTYIFTPLATDREPESFGAWSPDEKSVAYEKRFLGVPQIFIRSLDSPIPTQLTNLADGAAYPFWSHDGGRIFFSSGGKLWSVGAAGGVPQEEISLPRVGIGTISPDGNTLALWARTNEGDKVKQTLWISSPPGDPPRKYIPAPFEVTGSLIPNFLRFSPDGSKIGLSIFAAEGPQFWVLDWPDGPKTKPRRPFPEKDIGENPPTFDWLLDSKHVVMSLDGNIWLGDTRNGELKCLAASPDGGAVEPSISPDGGRLLFSKKHRGFDIIAVPLDGSAPRPFLATSRREYSPSWTAAGDRMAYITDRSGSDEVWIRSANSDWDRPVVTRGDLGEDKNVVIFNTVISPDGKRLAFNTKSATSGGKIWISPSLGGRPVQAIPSDPEARTYENGVSWAPDSSSFACNISVNGVSRLAVVRVGSQAPPEFVETPAAMSTAPAWSPDGRWIAYGCGPESSIVLISPERKESKKLMSPVRPYFMDFVIVWSRDSSSVYIASSRGEARLDVINVSTGQTRRIAGLGGEINFQTPANFVLSGCLMPDGQAILTSESSLTSDLWILDGAPLPGRRR